MTLRQFLLNASAGFSLINEFIRVMYGYVDRNRAIAAAKSAGMSLREMREKENVVVWQDHVTDRNPNEITMAKTMPTTKPLDTDSCR